MKPLAITCVMIQDEKNMFWGHHAPIILKLLKDIRGIDDLRHCDPLKQALLNGVEKR